MLTGGKLNPREGRQRRWGARRVRRAVKRGEEVTDKTSKRRGGREGMVKRMLKKDVLYLMVVNLPSEEEIGLGREIVEGEETEGKEEL